MGLRPAGDSSTLPTTGCAELNSLYIFDCGFLHKDVTDLVLSLHKLTFLGYKETGKVIKRIHQMFTQRLVDGQAHCLMGHMNFTHLNNMGTRVRRLIPQGLRFKRAMTEYTMEVKST